ncbi:hypothetical protein M0D21_22865, partial [Aquimarina sp. D1M17]|uniref:hypothetical protein n=1 Tax=Aquimarina acroporae TaxID=2937283 RepID=UPI0020BF408D
QSSKGASVEKVYVLPSIGNGGRMIDVDKKDQSFMINSVFLNKNDTLRLSTIRSNGSMVKSNMSINVERNRFKKPFSGKIPDFIDIKNQAIQSEKVYIPQSFMTDDIQALDEVVIRAKKREQEELEDKFVPIRFKRHTKKITEKDARMYPNILDYLRTQGYMVSYNAGGVSIIQPWSRSSPEIYVNDVLLSSFDVLANLESTDVNRILIDKRGVITALRGNGTILIYTRIKPLGGYSKRKESKQIIKKALDNGFEPIKEFYNPRYPSYTDKLFKQYGTIHWLPDLYIDQGSGATTFKIPDLPVKDMKFFVEGMGSDGSLISKEITINNTDPK